MALKIKNLDSDPSPLFDSDPSPLFDSDPSPLFDSDPSPLFDSDPTSFFDSDPTSLFDSHPTSLFDSHPTSLFDSHPTSLFDSHPTSLFDSHTPNSSSYFIFFLGNTEVDQPKGTEIVKEAVRKLKFQRHIKKSEGQKTQKVELQISIYGVKILDPKTKDVQYNCQLHRISFCADDKTDKRIFTFICTEPETKKHICYVFDSEKCAEEVTLTIGQAFDLAYKKFLESGGKDVETRKQIGTLQKRIQELETENSGLKKQLWELEEQLMIAPVPPQLHINSTNEAYMLSRPSSLFWCHNLTSFSCLEISSVTLTPMSSPESNLSAGLLTPPPAKPALLPKPADGCSIPRPRAGSISLKPPMSTDVFDMVPFSAVTPLVPIPASNGTPPPPTTTSPPDMSKDLFGAEPFDPFTCGQADFPPDIQSRLDEMQEGFKMGLTLEATVFSLEPLGGRC
ncbi:PTB domain-containing engulfment adapter protein 1-like [Salvelinus sp. IW2-2015]|uniref:PTB domain-containing engulfment adapter protein 1-like n=1 Tax=Salvelinus sp. IW2-2015 TaxID=2691554 RepID=UPI0038D361B9